MAFGAALALCVVTVTAYVTSNRWVDHSLQVSAVTTEWLRALIDAETGARGYIISEKQSFLEPYSAALTKAQSAGGELHDLFRGDPDQLHIVEAAELDATQVLERLRAYVELVSSGHRDDAVTWLAGGESRVRMDSFRERIAQLRAQEASLLASRRAEQERRALVALLGIVALSLTSASILWYAWALQRQRERELVQLATDARRRLHALSNVAEALGQARLRSDVAKVIVEKVVSIAEADTCTLYLLNEAGDTLDLIAELGVPRELVPRLKRLPVQADKGMGTPLLAGALWAADEREYARLFPEVANAKAEGRRAKAFWSVPLIVEGNPVGALAMGFYERQQFSLERRTLVETLAKQCGQALYRALRLEREDEARRWFTTTLRSIGDAVIATDGRGEITFMNPVAEGLTAWTEADARGKRLEEVFRIFSEESGDVVESPVTKVLREGTVVGLANHTVLHAKDGKVLPINDSGAPIRNEQGDLTGVVLVFRDATAEKVERVRREYLARASETLISTLDYEATLEGVARLAVPTLADWCGIDLLEPGGRAPRSVAVAHIDPEKVQFVRRLQEQYPPDPHATTGAPQVIRSGKSELYVDIPQTLLEAAAQGEEHLRLLRSLQLRSAISVPLIGRERILGAMTFVYAESGRRYNSDDLSFAEDFARRAALAIENAMALKEAETARIKQESLRADAEIASRAKDEFLAIVSHELRTPLNAILGWAVMLQNEGPRDDFKRGLGVIERNARTQAKLIDDVLDVSRIISGKLALNMSETNLVDALVSSIETITPAAQAKSIEVRWELPDEPLWITADPDRLQQVIWNLLTNAVKFTPKGGTVTLHAEREGSDVRVSVTDTGEGIRSDTLPLVFDPFQQADASTTRRHGGLGLGLAIVKQLVVGHGGSVEARSDGQGKGATFVVRFPARVTIPALAPRTPATGAAIPSAGATTEVRLDGLRILAVDDEADALALVSELLATYGADVVSATSAQDAYAKFEASRPHLIVSDVGMPFEDGYSFIRRIRARPMTLGGGTPAVALTAYAGTKDQRLARDAGFHAHLAKPVEPVLLATVLAQLARAASK